MLRHSSSSSEIENVWATNEFVAPGATQFIRSLILFASIILGWFSISLEVMVRYDFGERYLGIVRIYMAFVMMSWVFILPSFFFGAISNRYISMIVIYAILAIIHRLRIWQRRKTGIVWHSQSFGVSLLGELLALIPGLDYLKSQNSDWLLYRFIEPFTFLALGVLLNRIDWMLGTWLLIASASMFIKNEIIFYAEYDRILDIVDGSIEASYYSAALEGQGKKETAGFSVVSAPAGFILPTESSNLSVTVAETMGSQVQR